MTDNEKRAHDIAISLISKKDFNDIQEAVDSYKQVYFMTYDYIKDEFPEE